MSVTPETKIVRIRELNRRAQTATRSAKYSVSASGDLALQSHQITDLWETTGNEAAFSQAHQALTHEMKVHNDPADAVAMVASYALRQICFGSRPESSSVARNELELATHFAWIKVYTLLSA